MHHPVKRAGIVVLIAAMGLLAGVPAGASEPQFQAVAGDTLFDYQYASFRSAGGSWHVKWRLRNRTARTLYVGVLKARYACPEGTVEYKHYISKDIGPGEEKGNISDAVCKNGPPGTPHIVDVEFRDPDGPTSGYVLACDGESTASERDRRYVVDARLLGKGIARFTFGNGVTYTFRFDEVSPEIRRKSPSQMTAQEKARWEKSGEAGMIRDVCGAAHGGDRAARGFYNQVKSLVQDAARKAQAECRKTQSPQTCGDEKTLKSMQTGGPRG